MNILRINDIGVYLIPRAGSTSARWTVRDQVHDIIDRTPLPNIPIYAFVRDPVERLISGARALPGRYHKTPEGMTYPEYVDMVLSGDTDEHWLPQSQMLSGIADLRVRPFEKINYYWTTELMPLGFPQLRYENKTISENGSRQCVLDTRYRIAEIIDYYSGDYALRNG